MIEIKAKLPDTLSGLIYTALSDLEKAEKDTRYRVDMSTWHEPVLGTRDICEVCLGGAVMAFSLNVPENMFVIPNYLPLDACMKIKALDKLREGDVLGAASLLGTAYIQIDVDELPFVRRKIVNYTYLPALFKQQMLEMADSLKIAGF